MAEYDDIMDRMPDDSMTDEMKRKVELVRPWERFRKVSQFDAWDRIHHKLIDADIAGVIDLNELWQRIHPDQALGMFDHIHILTTHVAQQ